MPNIFSRDCSSHSVTQLYKIIQVNTDIVFYEEGFKLNRKIPFGILSKVYTLSRKIMKSCVLIKRKLTKALGQFPEIDQGKEVDQGPWSISRILGLMCILIRSKPPSFQSPQCTRPQK